MSDIVIIDDFINKTYQDAILSRVTENKFPWYFNPNMVTPEFHTSDSDKEYNHSGFNHFCYEDRAVVSNIFEFLHPMILQIQDNKMFPYNILERVRFNLTQKYTGSARDYHLPHIDSDYEHYNAIYYVNDADGDTFIFNETNETYDRNVDVETMLGYDFTIKEKISPKKGRLLFFPGHYYHASSFCTKSPYRIILNMNFGNISV
jgi:hypothetical protein